MTKRFIFFLALLYAATANGQSSMVRSAEGRLQGKNGQSSMVNGQWQSPVDYDISLAGNFGEPRPHHFHGGLDIRTEGVEGKHIYAIGDGYVSRITVGLYGFGNAVYITHPTGHTSVYCHLKSFSPRIKAALRRYQYRHETSVADARLTPLDCPVSQGQFIALSGNSGSSTAPHLHLEIHDTRTWDMLDPYEFLADLINDTVPPRAHGFMACPQDQHSSFNGSYNNYQFTLHSSSPKDSSLFTLHSSPPKDSSLFTLHSSPPKDSSLFTLHSSLFTAWGRVGFALWADDYMQGSYNHYGVRDTRLLVDGQEVFHSCVERIPVAQNRLVNSWGDYDHWLHRRTWYLRSYKEPGNNLAILRTDQHRGIIDFNEERDYHLEYILSDYKGNETRYSFIVKGEKHTPKPISDSMNGDEGRLLRWNQTNTYSLPGMQLVVPYGLLTHDVYLHSTVKEALELDALSDTYTFHDCSLPLVSDATVSLYVQCPVEDTSKLYVTSDGKYIGGDYADGWVTGSLRELGAAYTLAYDDEPPVVRPVSTTAPRLVLTATDAQSGIASWTATVDGRFIVFDAIEKTTSYVCDLRETWLPSTGTTHRLQFTVTDNRQNTTTFNTTFVY